MLARYTDYPLARLVPRLRTIVAKVLLTHGSLVHKWRLEGGGSIPRRGGALLVYYHGPLPIDYIYLVAWLYLREGRLVNSIVHTSLLRVPGLQTIAELFNCRALSRQQCIELINKVQTFGKHKCYENI